MHQWNKTLSSVSSPLERRGRAHVHNMTRQFVLVAAVLSGLAVRASAGPLNPLDFQSLSTLNLSTGSYTFNTTTDQLLDSNKNVLFTGVTSNGIAVFDFNQVVIGGGTFTATGSNPLALLSRGDIIVNGTIDVSSPG